MHLEILLLGVALVWVPSPDEAFLLFHILFLAQLFISLLLSADLSPDQPLLLPPSVNNIPFLISPPLHLPHSHALRVFFHPVFSASYIE